VSDRPERGAGETTAPGDGAGAPSLDPRSHGSLATQPLAIPPGLDATLVLVRHGETEGIRQDRFQGQWDVPLSSLGRASPRGSPELHPSAATFFTETWNDGDSNGGDASRPYHIRHMAYQSSVGGIWTFVNTNACNLSGDGRKYFCGALGDEVWTWTVQ